MLVSVPPAPLTHSLNYPSQTRMGFARVAPRHLPGGTGQGFKGQARGADFRASCVSTEVDRWNPIPVADHPYDLELCDLCVRQCPDRDPYRQCEDGKPAVRRPEPVPAASCNPSAAGR